MRFALVAVLLLACARVDTTKVTSVVDPQRIDAVQELAVWREQADALAKTAPAGCEPRYTAARQQLNGWLDGPLAVQIDQAANRVYGAVDLTAARIPAAVGAAVGEFQTCATGPAERGLVPEDVANRVVAWATQQAKAQRKQSAQALKAQLEGYRWASWTEARGEAAAPR
ncbi:MAG TPA: hypothetical protein VFL83_14110 [Anaeromyxobacter sp.]|nr:hypothetical protein [Anaeromyxobacter sp.]